MALVLQLLESYHVQEKTEWNNVECRKVNLCHKENVFEPLLWKLQWLSTVAPLWQFYCCNRFLLCTYKGLEVYKCWIKQEIKESTIVSQYIIIHTCQSLTSSISPYRLLLDMCLYLYCLHQIRIIQFNYHQNKIMAYLKCRWESINHAVKWKLPPFFKRIYGELVLMIF